MSKYEVKLGINFDNSELKKVESKINNLTDNTHRIRIDFDTSRIHKQFDHIEKRFKNLTGTKSSANNIMPIDTTGLNKSLGEIAKTIGEIKSSIGSLDDGNMKSLVSSINQIATSLGKATDESESLVSALNALSKKDFGINIGLKLGGNSVSNAGAYGAKVKNEILPELKRQEQEIGKVLAKHYKTNEIVAINKLAGSELGGVGGVIAMLDKLEQPFNKKGDNLELRMREYQDFFNVIKRAVTDLKDPDLSSALSSTMSGFSKSVDELIKDAHDIKNGVKETEDSFEKLKSVFSGGNLDVDGLASQLKPIVENLEDIKRVIGELSSNSSFSGLTQSFNRLSEALEQVMNNAKLVQNVLNSGISNTSVGNISNTIQQTGKLISNSTQKAIDNVSSTGINKYFKINKSDSDDFRNEMDNLVRQWTSGKGNLVDLKIDTRTSYSEEEKKNIERLHQAQVTYNNALGETVKKTIAWRQIGTTKNSKGEDIPLRGFVEVASQYSKSLNQAEVQTNNFINKQKRIVSDLTNQAKQLHQATIDPNTAKPIKEQSHLTSLKSKYKEIEVAIADMGNASNEAFTDAQIKVKNLISDYKILKSEYKNAESVATSLRSKDIDTVKNTYSSKLDVLISKMRKDGVYSTGFEKGAENLRSMLSGATDASGLVQFLNGLDKLDAGYKRASASAKEFQQSQKVGIKTSGLQSQISELQKINPEINKFETEINGAKVTVSSLLSELNGVKTQGDFSVVNAKFKAFVDSAKDAGISVGEVAEKVRLLERITNKLEFSDEGISGFDTELSKIYERYNKLSSVSNKLEKEMRLLDSAFDEIKAANDTEELITAYKKYEKILKSIKNQLEINERQERQSNNNKSLELDKARALERLKGLFGENSQAARKFASDIERIQKELEACGDSKGVQRLNKEIDTLALKAKNADVKTQSLGQRLKKEFSKYSTYFSAASVFMYVEQGLKDMFQQVVAIDTAMTELKKVTDETNATYNQFLTSAGQRASEIGTTVDGLVTSTADFARLGYEFGEAANLAEVANIYTVVGDEIDSVDTATQSVISTMKAFKVEASDSMSIVDKFNEVSNNFAISSGGIGEALTRSASSLAAANNSLDESIALITASNSVVNLCHAA